MFPVSFSVPRGSESFKQEKQRNVSIKHVATHQYLRVLCSQKIIYASPNPEKITIYYYKSIILERCFRGLPVVLNLTESNCFLRCCMEGERALLQVETCEKQRLKQISKSDESTLSFLFYMTGDRTKQLKFESALYSGWFIHIVNTDSVEMGCLCSLVTAVDSESSLLIVILLKGFVSLSFRICIIRILRACLCRFLFALSGTRDDEVDTR